MTKAVSGKPSRRSSGLQDHRQLRQLISGIRDGVVLVDLDQTILWANEPTLAMHGPTTWALTTLVVLYLLSTAVDSIAGGAFRGIASAVGGVDQTVAPTAAPALANSNPLDAIKNEVQETGTDPQALAASATDSIKALILSDNGGTPEAKQKAAETLAKARNILIDEAKQQVDQIVTQVRQSIDTAKQTAVEAADTAASVVSTGTLLAFFGLVLGGVAAWSGGRSGVVHPIYADHLVPGRRRI